MEKLLKWAGLAGIAAVALVTLAINAIGMRNDLNKGRINEWQEVTVFSTIADGKIDGLTFDEIQRNYAVKAKDLPDELPRTEIQTQALKRVLLNLITKRAISMRTNGNYGITIDPIMPSGVSMLETSVRMQPVGDQIYNLVSKEPGRYTTSELSNIYIRADLDSQMKSLITF